MVIYACPNGIRMSPDIEGLVQTSNNLARVAIENGQLVIVFDRSAVETRENGSCTCYRRNFAQMGCAVEPSGNYLVDRPSSAILTTMRDLYERCSKSSSRAAAIGLEWNLGTNYPGWNLSSLSNIRGAHSPDEKCQISSVQKSWNSS